MKGTGTKIFKQLSQGEEIHFFFGGGHFCFSQAEMFWMRRKWEGKKDFKA